MPPSGIKGHKLKVWIRTQRFQARNKIVKWIRNVIARWKASKVRLLNVMLVYCKIITIYMQLCAVMRHLKRLESEMPQDEFEYFERKLLLAIAPQFADSASGAAILAEALQVEQFCNLLYIIAHYLRLSAVTLGMISTFSRRSRPDP